MPGPESPQNSESFRLKFRFDQAFEDLCAESNYGITRTVENNEAVGHIFTLGEIISQDDSHFYKELSFESLQTFFTTLVETLADEFPDQNWNDYIKFTTIGDNHYIAVNFRTADL